jgi:hypothetical protein
MQAKRYFNTSGPNISKEHYTLFRTKYIEKGKDLVYRKRYFTIWAPRQTGKSTYFRQLADELEKEGYKTCYINFENFKITTEQELFDSLSIDFKNSWNIDLSSKTFVQLFDEIRTIIDQKLVFICDEIEGLNPELFNQFLHTIRNLYHSREKHSLKSVILVGVSNITGVIQDNASPFNIADELPLTYFTNEETKELLEQHTTETGQQFAPEVVAKISEITANQPGLVNGFAKVLVDRNEDKPILDLQDYEIVEEWYTTKALDKNIGNILKFAKKNRSFVERLLFNEEEIPFIIDNPSIRELYVNGLITYNEKNNVCFWVPLYKKRVYQTLYPYTNGEGKQIAETMFTDAYLTEEGKVNFNALLDAYKAYIQLRSFRPFRKKNKKGKYISIPEAAMVYSFETFITIFIRELNGRIYREPYISLGNTDILINVVGFEYLLEIKKYYSPSYFAKGKKQLSYYCRKAGLDVGHYIVFIKEQIQSPLIREGTEVIDDIKIITYLIRYDEKKDF